VTGTVVDATNGKQADGVRHESDGDTHGWLKVDAGEEGLLDAGNMSDEGGNLVFEVICKYSVKQADAKAACQGFTNQVNLPLSGPTFASSGHMCRTHFIPSGWRFTQSQPSPLSNNQKFIGNVFGRCPHRIRLAE